jgi:hypothetical protein
MHGTTKWSLLKSHSIGVACNWHDATTNDISPLGDAFSNLMGERQEFWLRARAGLEPFESKIYLVQCVWVTAVNLRLRSARYDQIKYRQGEFGTF